LIPQRQFNFYQKIDARHQPKLAFAEQNLFGRKQKQSKTKADLEQSS